MSFCSNLQVVPTLLNLASLDMVDMKGCSQLRNFPDISTNIRTLIIEETMLQELAKSVRLWFQLGDLTIYGSVSGAGIEKVPDWIKDLPGLELLQILSCTKLKSVPELPGSLNTLIATTCESLETLAIDSPIVSVFCPNCFKLGQESRKVITQQSVWACLPGRTIPEEFDHRAKGNSLTFRPGICGFRICLVVSPTPETIEHITWYSRSRIFINGCRIDHNIITGLREIQGEHLCITRIVLSDEAPWLEPDQEILLEIITTHQEIEQ